MDVGFRPGAAAVVWRKRLEDGATLEARRGRAGLRGVGISGGRHTEQNSQKGVSFGRARALFQTEGERRGVRRRWRGEKEAFIEWLYTAVRGESWNGRASTGVRHRGEYRDLVDDSIQKTFLKACEEYDAAEGRAVYRGVAVQGLPASAADGDEHLPQTAEAARGAGWTRTAADG